MSVLHYEIHCFEALSHYVRMGLPPGGMLTHLLAGDLEGAKRRLHPLLKRKIIFNGNEIEFVDGFYQELHDNMLPQAYGSIEKVNQWVNHQGLINASDEVKMLVKLSDDYSEWINTLDKV